MTPEIKHRIEAVRRGEVPEGYKLSESIPIPEGWDAKPLSEISEVLTESAGDREYETLSISAGIGFVNQAEKFGKELSGKQYEKYTVLCEGDFAYNKGNSKKYPQGCTYQLVGRTEAAVPNVFECFRMVGVEPSYYAQLFINGYMNHQLARKINHGVRDDGLLNLTEDDFFSTVLPTPPLPEQQRIAEILSTCDKVIELKQKLIEEKRRQKKWLMQKLLNPDSGVRLPGFEGSKWNTVKLKDSCTMFSGGTPKAGEDTYYDDGVIPFIRSAEIGQSQTELFLTEEGLKNSSAKMVEEGDLLYALYGANSGDCAIARIAGAINQAILCIRPQNIDRDFLYQLLCAKKDFIISTYLQGGQGNLSADILKKICVQIPAEKEEQIAISAILKSADTVIDIYEQELAAWQQKKKALMQLLLTGLVRVKV